MASGEPPRRSPEEAPATGRRDELDRGEDQGDREDDPRLEAAGPERVAAKPERLRIDPPEATHAAYDAAVEVRRHAFLAEIRIDGRGDDEPSGVRADADRAVGDRVEPAAP